MCGDPGLLTCVGPELNDCSGNGDCLLGRCYCHSGWGGPDCNTPVCISACPNVRPLCPPRTSHPLSIARTALLHTGSEALAMHGRVTHWVRMYVCMHGKLCGTESRKVEEAALFGHRGMRSCCAPCCAQKHSMAALRGAYIGTARRLYTDCACMLTTHWSVLGRIHSDCTQNVSHVSLMCIAWRCRVLVIRVQSSSMPARQRTHAIVGETRVLVIAKQPRPHHPHLLETPPRHSA